MMKPTLPKGYWIAHRDWVWQDRWEGRADWKPVSPDELEPDLARAVREYIADEAKVFGWDRAPRLWKRVD